MSIRLRGLALMVGGGVVAYAMLNWMWQSGYTFLWTAPLVVAMIGLIEAITGVSMTVLNERWNALPWYVKLPVGVVVGVILITVVLTFVFWAASVIK